MPFLRKDGRLWRCDKTKEKGLGLSSVENYEKVNIWGKLTESKGYLSKVCLCRFISIPTFRLHGHKTSLG